MEEPNAPPPEQSVSSPQPDSARPSPSPATQTGDEPRATATQVAVVAGSVGLVVGFAAGLLVASTGSDTRTDAPAQAASSLGAAASVASAPVRPPEPPSAAPSAAPPAEEATDSFHLDLRREDHRARLVSGFYGVEATETDTPAVWSQGSTSTIALPLTPSEEEYRLSLFARTLETIAPLSIGLRLNGKRLDKVTIRATPTSAEVAVPNRVLKAGTNELVLSYPKTAKPSATIPGATDERDLALDLFGLELRPK